MAVMSVRTGVESEEGRGGGEMMFLAIVAEESHDSPG